MRPPGMLVKTSFTMHYPQLGSPGRLHCQQGATMWQTTLDRCSQVMSACWSLTALAHVMQSQHICLACSNQ